MGFESVNPLRYAFVKNLMEVILNQRLTADGLMLLKKAVTGLVHKSHASIPIGVVELNHLGLVYANIGPRGSTGFLPEGASAISELASLLHRQSERYRRGTDFASLRLELANRIIALFGAKEEALSAPDVARIQDDIATWFAGTAVRRIHYVPCTIIPYEANQFTVGPIRFIHEKKFLEERPKSNAACDLAYETVLKALQERHACWVATVTVENAEEKRSLELADLSVDIALSGLHLVLPQDVSQRMSRINGRTWPAWSSLLFTTSDQNTHSGISNSQPGLTMHPESFNLLINGHQLILDSVGRRISSFLNLNTPFNGLERSWCDAAYWLHEALSEPLDTIALAKFETAIEILLCAGSSQMSEARIRTAFSAFLGLKKDDVLSPDSQVTVKDFSKSIVKARSRVLHGTWSTLTNEMSVSRKDVTALTLHFVRAFTSHLDLYLNTNPANADKVEAFLDWIAEQRARGKGLNI